MELNFRNDPTTYTSKFKNKKPETKITIKNENWATDKMVNLIKFRLPFHDNIPGHSSLLNATYFLSL